MKYQVCRPLTPIEYEALKADIADNGVLVPVEVDETGEILDGHHRVQAWQELRNEGVEVANYARLVRSGLTEEQKRNHARKLNLLRRQMDKAEREQLMIDMRKDGMSYRQIAEATGVSTMTAHNTVKNSTVQNYTVDLPGTITGKDGKERPAVMPRKPEPPATLFDPGDNVELDPKAAEETAKENRAKKSEQRREERIDRINEISQNNAPLGAGLDRLYPVVYADPPWRYEHSQTTNREIENHYPTMSLDEICALPVQDLTTDPAILFLWTTSPKLAESMRVIDSWGFVYRTCMVWDKDKIGMGYYARQQHELLLIAVRGEMPVPLPEQRPPSVIRIRRSNEHSEKPCEFREVIERMYPELSKIELFARSTADGWARWGNQA